MIPVSELIDVDGLVWLKARTQGSGIDWIWKANWVRVRRMKTYQLHLVHSLPQDMSAFALLPAERATTQPRDSGSGEYPRAPYGQQSRASITHVVILARIGASLGRSHGVQGRECRDSTRVGSEATRKVVSMIVSANVGWDLRAGHSRGITRR